MTIELQGIRRLVGATSAAEPAATMPAGAGGFVTSVQRARETTPFETVVKRAEAEKAGRANGPATAAPAGAPATATAPLGTPATSPAARAGKAQKSFEAFALQVFIGSMLPKENSKMFGTGNAGKMWQSMLAEKLADQITASGRLKLLPQQPAGTAAAAPGPVAGATAPAGATGTSGSAAAPAVQAANNRPYGANGMTPTALQELIGSLKPGRSGGIR